VGLTARNLTSALLEKLGVVEKAELIICLISGKGVIIEWAVGEDRYEQGEPPNWIEQELHARQTWPANETGGRQGISQSVGVSAA
jgi:hypothetical protein